MNTFVNDKIKEYKTIFNPEDLIKYDKEGAWSESSNTMISKFKNYLIDLFRR